MKKFAAFDIDGTLFRSGLYREVIYELIRMGSLPKSVLQSFADKEKAWQKRAHGIAFKEFEQAQAEALDEYLPNLRVADFDAAANKVIANHKDNVYVYTRDLARNLKDDGYLLIAISGSQIELVEPFAKHYDFDICVGQTHMRNGEFFTGESIKTHKGKDKFLTQLITEHNLTLKDSYAVGDSAGDIEMLEMVEKPIAFNPEHRLFSEAQAKGWTIVLERKNMMYELAANEAGVYEMIQTNHHPF